MEKTEETENRKAFTVLEMATMKRVFSLARKASHDDLNELESIIAFEKVINPKMHQSFVTVKKQTNSEEKK